MDVDTDLLQQPSFFQRLSAAQHCMADDGVVLSQESGREGLSDRLLFQKPERTEATVGEESLVGQPELQSQRCKQRIFARRRQRISQPFPGVSFIGRRSLALHHGKRFLPVRPAAEQLAAEHKIRTSVENAQQIPQLIDFGLDWRRRAKQQVLGATADPQHEIEQVVRLFLLLTQPAAPACLVRLVEDDGAVLAFQQVLAFVGIVEDQSGGNDGDAEWATGDVLRSARLDDVALGIDPYLLRRRPNRTRNAELVR